MILLVQLNKLLIMLPKIQTMIQLQRAQLRRPQHLSPQLQQQVQIQPNLLYQPQR